MSNYNPPPEGPFTGDISDPYVSRFLDAMGTQRRSYALQVVSVFVRAGSPPWMAQQCLAQLTKAIEHIPPRARNGARLEIIEGDKS